MLKAVLSKTKKKGMATSFQHLSKEERIEWAKKNKIHFPESYRINSSKEDLVLEYVEHFRKQYIQLYPTRPPLILNPPND